MEDRYDISVDIGDGKDWWYVHGLATHDKVYELNRQMCDLDIPLRNPIKPLSEETAQELIGKWEKIGKEWASKKKEIFESIFGNITNEKSNIMEKKTKKMTKAEAFEYLKGKKIECICAVAHEDAQANKVERLLKDVGCKYHFANHISWCDWYWPLYGFIVDKKGEIYVAFENQKDFFAQDLSEPISADDILSIEIVDAKYELEFNYDKVVDLASPLMHYLNEVGCQDSIRVSQLGIVHEPMSTLIFDNGIGE